MTPTLAQRPPTPAPAAGRQVEPGDRTLRPIPDAQGAVQLIMPARCRHARCGLVVVPHGRGGQALDGVTHPPSGTLPDVIDAQGYVLLCNDSGRETRGSPVILTAIGTV
ncbi:MULTISPECIES: hypothetical protein [Deinococcus]|uniref:Uncharacterized protein n=1 Tax=Deinococcus rufus TaxID=2136097 RepID=A0ABV7Z9M7_9DEIO|nr:hypothetical protein [Deinococcus sp. AB2017081]WQE97227.1 hypothetical protein U2P90_18395 [Deinococcus sp. AB2017081]